MIQSSLHMNCQHYHGKARKNIGYSLTSEVLINELIFIQQQMKLITGSYSLKVIICMEKPQIMIVEKILAFKNGSVIKLMLRSLYFLPIGLKEYNSTLYQRMEKPVLLAINCSYTKAMVTKKLGLNGKLVINGNIPVTILKI